MEILNEPRRPASQNGNPSIPAQSSPPVIRSPAGMGKCQDPNVIGQIQVMNNKRKPAHHLALKAIGS
jgi:hypothetical protein